MARRSKWYRQGVENGKNIASWIDLPNIGETFWTESEGRITVEDKNSAADVFFDAATQAESNSRQYDDFSYLAQEINSAKDSEKGIMDGISKSWRERSREYYK